MRLNRPCVIENGVFDTPAFELWGFVNKSQYAPYTGEGAQNWLKPERAYAYLADKIGGKEVVVYDDRNPEKVTFGNPAFNTFKSESRARMTY
jgi:hypothetical protein